MRVPRRPPSESALWERYAGASKASFEKLGRYSGAPLVEGKYLHWDKLRHYTPPEGLNHEQWWLALKLTREYRAERLPLTSTDNRGFWYVPCDPIPERLRQIDLGMGGAIGMPEQITNTETRDRYYVNSLIQEAITSSQLEGAATTREVAKEMIRTKRKPRDRSERMILNNFQTMRAISRMKDEPLSKELILKLHRTVTVGTLDKESAAGRWRGADEQVTVSDAYGEVVHVPPRAESLEERMGALCDFANGKIPAGFVHPVIRSIALHFWLAYDHPFLDGNGRTARALFYWSMLRHGYWLFEFVSISEIMVKAPSRYGRAFLYTETDDNDLTYFIVYHLEVIDRAIRQLHAYIETKAERVHALEEELKGMAILNHRQRALIGHGLRHPHYRYTVESHRTSHNVVYETARRDLLELQDRGLLRGRKVGKTWYFTPVEDMEQRLAELP